MLFPWYTKYPYQNDEILNLDWVLRTIDNLVKEVADFVTLNTIKYADPIQWNITTQYEKNTVVIDPISGSAYISTKPVPAGVGLNNTDYWNIIFTLDVISANKNLTLRDDANNMLATFESVEGDWLLWQGTLYKVTSNISIGQAYVEDYNITIFTVEMFIKEYITYVVELIGDLDDLTTTEKTTLVGAINELKTITDTIGDLDDLTTTDKDSIVDAINELVSALSTLSNNLGDLNVLVTTDKDSAVGAINELAGEITSLKEAKNIYELVSDMVADTSLASGDIVATLGYHAAGIGGCIYLISDTAGTGAITLSNGKYAMPRFSSDIHLSQLGAQADDDISGLINTAISLINGTGVIHLDANYKISSLVTITLASRDNITIDGHEHDLSYNDSTSEIRINVTGVSPYDHNFNVINTDFRANGGLVALSFNGLMSAVNRSEIKNCTFWGFKTSLYIHNSRMLLLDNIACWDIPDDGAAISCYAESSGFVGDFEIHNSQFSSENGNAGLSKYIAFNVDSTSTIAGIVIDACDFYVCDTCIYFISSGTVNDVWIINSQFDGASNLGINVYGSGGANNLKAHNWHIESNYATSPKQFLQWYTPSAICKAIFISSNYINGNSNSNFTMDIQAGSSASVTVSKNILVNCNKSADAPIRISGVRTIIFTDNQLDYDSGVYANSALKISSVTNSIVIGNVTMNITSTAWQISSTTNDIHDNNIPSSYL